MPNLNDIINEANAAGNGYDIVRKKYLQELQQLTNRNVIVYYSGWLQKPAIPELAFQLVVNDADKNGFMAAIHQMDRSLGLDLVLHTPGGDIAATESLVHYLRQMFGTDIRAFVPQLAMSAGTMIALSCKEIVMGKHSNLGPIDPQIGTMPAQGILAEFRQAAEEIRSSADAKEQSAKIAVWQPIIAKYSPTLIGQCQHAIEWSRGIVVDWLKTGMFAGESDADAKALMVANELARSEETKTHARHIHVDALVKLGLKIRRLEENQELQNAVLSVHHSCINTLMQTPAVKIIQNGVGITHILAVQLVQQTRQG